MSERTYVSRGGVKLAAGLDAFALDPTALICADLGCHVGGFTDCLRQRGAARVYAVDSCYGTLAWKLRCDDHVVVLERTNILHFNPGGIADFSRCELVVIDLGWTCQRHAVPAALKWLSGSVTARIVTLIKPHYEAPRSLLVRGVLSETDADAVCAQTLRDMPVLGVEVIKHVRSPIRGGASRRRNGNIEYLALLKPFPRRSSTVERSGHFGDAGGGRGCSAQSLRRHDSIR